MWLFLEHNEDALQENTCPNHIPKVLGHNVSGQLRPRTSHDDDAFQQRTTKPWVGIKKRNSFPSIFSEYF